MSPNTLEPLPDVIDPPFAEPSPESVVVVDQQGWFTLQWPAEDIAADDALDVHDRWKGPGKLVHVAEHVYQRIEFAVPKAASALPRFLDGLDAEQGQRLRRGIADAARRMRADPANYGPGNPLLPSMVREMIEAEGFALATDEKGDLRFAIGFLDFDGQARVECTPRCLRLSMMLGQWTALPPSVEAVMRQLAEEANAGTRLVRIAWQEESPQRRCEAQVDLTGLPWVTEEDPWFESAARHGLQLALSSLGVAARRLGRELQTMSDPQHRELVDAVHQRTEIKPGWGPR